MANLIALLKMIAVLILGAAVGNWFLRRVKQGRARGEAWYRAYLSVPGLIVLLALLGLPIFLLVINV